MVEPRQTLRARHVDYPTEQATRESVGGHFVLPGISTYKGRGSGDVFARAFLVHFMLLTLLSLF